MSQDYIALEWVRGEIQDTLQQAQKALEAYVEHPTDKSRLRFCLSYLHQVHGTLKMLEFYGAALLAEEMESVALALTEGTLSSERDGLEVLMQSIIQLPHYLEHVKVGRRDLPVVLLPVLNELRSARGKHFLSETSLFAPRIDYNSHLTDPQKSLFSQPNFVTWLRKTRQMLQASTLQLLKGRDVELAKRYINKIFAKLHKTMGGTPQGIVWLPALAFSEWLSKQDSLPKATKVLLRQLDQLLKTSIDEGIAAINQPPSDELLKNLLFYVARTDVRGEAIRLVQERFQLSESLPGPDDTDERAMGAGSDAMSGALSALIEEIASIKDAIDRVVRGVTERTPALTTAQGIMRRIVDTMGMLGLGMPRKVMQEQESALISLIDGDVNADASAQLVDIAGALLYVEASLNGMLQAGDTNRSSSDNANSEAQQAVLREARNVLEQIKDDVVSYIAHHWSTEKLQAVPSLLHSIEGSLGMIPMPKVASLLANLSTFIRQALMTDEGPAPEWDVMDMLAEVLSGIEYYLERYSDELNSNDVDIIDRAEATLTQLLQRYDIQPSVEEDLHDDELHEDLHLEGVEVTSFSDALDVEPIPSSGVTSPQTTDVVDELASVIENPGVDSSTADSLSGTTETIDSGPHSDTDNEQCVDPTAQQVSEEEIDQESVQNSNQDSGDDLIDDEIIEIFLEEAEEVIETLTEYWPAFKADAGDHEALTTVRRSFHTLKGSGRMVKAEIVGELSWSIENMFNRILDGTITINDDITAFIDQVIQLLPNLIEDFRSKRVASIDTKPLENYAFAVADGNQPSAVPQSGLELDAAVQNGQNQADIIQASDHQSDSLNGVEDGVHADVSTEIIDEIQVASAELNGCSDESCIDDEVVDDPSAERTSLLEIFIIEAAGHLDQIDDFVVESRETVFGNAINDALQRALHTLKGSAHMAELTPFADVASVMERLIKELRSYQLQNVPALVDLLEDTAEALRSCLSIDQLMTLQYVPGAGSLVERATQIEMDYLQSIHRDEAEGTLSPDTISQFLSSEMNALIEADRLLSIWHEEGRADILGDIVNDLSSVADSATDAGLMTVRDLALALHQFYQRVLAEEVAPDTTIVAFATGAHDDLLNMMDCLAASQDLPDVSATIRRVLDWPFAATETSSTVDVIDTDHPLEASTEAASQPLSTTSAMITDIASVREETLLSSPDVNASSQDELDTADIGEQEDDMILEIFLEEAEEITEAVEAIMQKWEESQDDLLPVAELQRELHTLKGGARMAELPEIADLCHELETLYERLNDGLIPLSADTLPLAQNAHDLLFTQLQSVRNGQVLERSELVIEALQAASAVSDSESNPIESLPALSPITPIQSETADESDREIVGIFLEEAGELMESLDEGIEQWKLEPSAPAGANELLRVLHTLKGGARLAGLSSIGDTAHGFEADVQKTLSLQARIDETFFAHLHQRQENLQSKIDAVAGLLAEDGVLVLGEKELVVDAPAVSPTVDFNHASDDHDVQQPEEQDGPTPFVSNSQVIPLPGLQVESTPPVSQPRPEMAQQRKAPAELVKVSADLLDDLVNLAGETSIGRGRLEEQVSDFAGTLSDMDQTLDRMRDQLRRLDIETEAQVLFRQERHGPDYEDFDPLEMDRYSAMQQLSRALMESASDLIDLKETLSGKTRDAETLLLQQSRVNTELQEGLMKTRMVPFQRMVPRLRRIVRQVSLELNKQVELRVNNADGEMDRAILERMISPLEHMVRNAIDHGIESSSERRAVNKPEKGHIELDIRRDGGDVVLTLRDDGRGINLDAVLRKARERGMVAEDVTPNKFEILQYILQPGFSTAEVVTQISGRGVGMDVVSSEIKQMGGSVEIRSEAGEGSEFEVRLPFTVSVNRALMVRIGEDLYAVPLNNIQGIVRASVAELQSLYDQPDGERVFSYAGRDYQLGYLGAMLDEHLHPKISGQQMPLPLLLVRGQVPFALQADALLGSREIVVKSLGPQFGGVRGISGGTILGDGSVVIILDLPAMIRTYTSLEYQQAKALDSKAAEARHEQERQLPKVLVVDDSVTVRKVTTRLLERRGIEVMTAKDGMHAMEVLQDVKPDVMLLDIEMPRMDGFEVASLVRHDSRLQDMPIIMITSRTGDKHRERAKSIGVDEYMGKPFQEDILLDTIHALLGQEVH